MKANVQDISRNGKIYMLAYDQGLEHGPTDFDGTIGNYDPSFVVNLAANSGATCLAMQYGMSRHFYGEGFAPVTPLILKINGKTRLNSTNHLAAMTASIEDALNLGAKGIGFTINPGQKDEHIAFEQFAWLRAEAEKAGLITVLWSYARGPEIQNQHDTNVVAYATRVAAELGADVIKVKYTGDADSFSWAVKVAGKSKVIASGTDNFNGDYVESVRGMMASGASGIAVGRKIWQSPDAENLSRRLAEVVLGNN